MLRKLFPKGVIIGWLAGTCVSVFIIGSIIVPLYPHINPIVPFIIWFVCGGAGALMGLL